MISTLWSLWLSRNEVVFKGEFLSVDQIVIMIKFRAKSWCGDIGLAMSEDDCIWNTYPAGIVLKNFNIGKNKLFEIGSDLLGFIDGSCSVNAENRLVAGVLER